MNNNLKIGLVLQIPNLLLLLFVLIVFLLPYLTLTFVVKAVLGIAYILINVASLIYIAVGLGGGKE